MLDLDDIRLVTPWGRTKTEGHHHILMPDGKTLCGRQAYGWIRMPDKQTPEYFAESAYSCARCVKKLTA